MCMRYPDHMLLTGQKAPVFQAKAIHGMISYPGDFKGHYLHCSRILKQMEEGGNGIIFERISIVEDADQTVAKKYCMIQTDYRFLRQTESVYIIDPLCRIRCIQNYTDSTWKELKEIKYIVEALQKSDTGG